MEEKNQLEQLIKSYRSNKKICKKLFNLPNNNKISKRLYEMKYRTLKYQNFGDSEEISKKKVANPKKNLLKVQKKNQIILKKQKTKIGKLHLKKKYKKPKAKHHKNWKLKKVLIGHHGWVYCTDIDPSNDFFATGSSDNMIKFWDLATGRLKLTLTGHISAVRALKISKKNTYLFSASEDKSVRCWDLNTNKCIRNYHGHLSGVYALDIHPKLNLIASAGRDAVIRLWDIRTRNQVHCFEGHQDTVFSLKMQEDEPQIISGSSDRSVRLWDLMSGKKFKSLTHHSKSVRALCVHPVEYSFLSVAADAVKLWKCPDGGFVRNFERTDYDGIMTSVDVSGEDVVCVGSEDGFLRFWDWESGDMFQKIKVLPQPGSLKSESGIMDVKFDYSSLRLITCEIDKTVKIWEQVDDEIIN